MNSRPRIPELGLYLIEGLGQLAVGLNHLPGHVRHHFLVGGSKAEFAIVAIGQREHDFLGLCIGVPAPRFLPEFSGLNLGHQDFLTIFGVHFLTDDLGDLLEYPPHQRHVGVEAATRLSNVPGPKQQLVAWDHRLLRILFLGDKQHLGNTHNCSKTSYGKSDS
jgi:hypothetical protein